ncbi:MAG TPA: AsmA-like C-terminal region-containing protein [Candidatus Binatia bacterium]|nr:AsmA-like C-terminal region-containing protein [Candidatus Binatia bacterium]
MKIPPEGETPKTTLGEMRHPSLAEPFSIWPTIAGAMKSPRKFLLLTLLTLVALISVLVQSFNILASKHREQVQQELQKVLGQDVSFDALEVNLFDRPGFVAKEFRIADDPRFAATPVVRAKELVLGVSVWNLFFGRFVIDSLTFNEPEFQIITNEAGLLNLTAFVNRKNELRKFPRLRPPAPERKHSPVAFAIGEVRIREGRVEYVDRSIKEPAELRVKNISMTMRELEPAQATKITIAASLSEGIGQDVRIEGQLKPAPGEHSWFRRSIDLSVRLDSLHVPVVARAIAGLRDKIPRELDVTGPMSFQAKLSGTPERPRIGDITLKVPLFGSSDYNAIINGSVEFSERRTWEDAQIQGKLVVAPLALTQLRKLRLFEQNLPPLLVAAGTLGIYSRFEGTWESLRVGALVRADKAELRYKGWLNKPANVPAEVRMRISRQKQRLLLHESEFVVGAAKMDFAGSIEYEPAPRLQLKVHGKQSPMPAWGQLFTPLDFYGVGGRADWDIDFNKGLTPADENWSVQGQLKLTNSGFEHLGNGRRIEKLDGQVFLNGKQARLNNVTFRLGSSMIFLDGTIANLLEPSVIYKLRSDEFNLTDLPLLDAGPPVRLKGVNANGEIQWDNGQLALTGSVTSPEGALQQFGFGNLRCDVALSAAGLTFKNLALQTLNGTFRSDGNWASAGESSRRLQMSSQVDALDLRALIAQWMPQLKDRIEGQLNGSAQFDAAATNGAGMMSVLKGSGEASIRRGVIRDFNLVSHLLLRGSGSSVSAVSTSRLPPGFAGLVKRPDTPVESLKANFAIDQKRIHTDNLIITTPDYTITGAGWLGFDRSTKWNGLIVLSPRLTQEVQRDYRIIRYLLDRRGRLGIPFVVEGEIPDVKIRLENRLLAQALRGGSAARGDDTDGGGKSSQESKEPKKWLPDALQRFLNR